MKELSEKEVQHNIQALTAAIEHYDREGITIPASTVADLHRAARGQINTDDVIRNIYRRFKGDTSKLAALVRATSIAREAGEQESRTNKLPLLQPERTRS
jgi:hypothetical protein